MAFVMQEVKLDGGLLALKSIHLKAQAGLRLDKYSLRVHLAQLRKGLEGQRGLYTTFALPQPWGPPVPRLL